MKIPFRDEHNDQYFKEIFEEYYAPLCVFARRIIPDMCICEDIVSEVFASLWMRRKDIELIKETTVAYLRMCVRNSCFNYLKHQNYETEYADICNKQTPIYASSPETIYTIDELYQRLNKTLDNLPENYRTVFVKNFFEGKTHAQIAEEMNVSVKTVNRYKQNTVRLLREDLKDYMPLLILLVGEQINH